MSTPQLYVKFSQPNGTTRAAVFATAPTWDVLATCVKSFFDIPKTSVALTYVDTDGDEVTLDTQYELQELLSTLPADAGSTTLKFVVRDTRGPRELRTPEDADRTMSTPAPGCDDSDELTVEQAGSPGVRGDGSEHEQVMPPDDERTPSGRLIGMPSIPPRGHGGHRGGRRGGRGGFGGPFHIHRGRPHGPFPFPGAHGPFCHGRDRFVRRGPPPPPIHHEIFRARSAPPEPRFDAPDSDPEDVFPPEDFISFHWPVPLFGGSHSQSLRLSREGGRDRRPHGHHYHHGGPGHFGRRPARGSPFGMGRGRDGAFTRDRGGFRPIASFTRSRVCSPTSIHSVLEDEGADALGHPQSAMSWESFDSDDSYVASFGVDII
ncbi:hypothetical protein DAEQUDRAFT_767205 [Daedalea quercina L-15889]|uniref:PB1 domain-containing protein n=1 Tax=Daedalea quercina L-15889 TaxID=1314783 RepID=A0A165NWW2_9APHY|nr:hypothetical protein DAEQUDRAFT_767205 [Daedalea quercina L-15889]